MTDHASSSTSYWGIVWQQLRGNRRAMVGLAVVLAFFALAFFAPFLAHRLPLVYAAPDGATRFPLLHEFFAPANTTEGGLERAFNYLLLYVPLAVLLLRVLPRWDDRASVGISRVLGVAISLGVIGATLGTLRATGVQALWSKGETTVFLVLAVIVTLGLGALTAIVISAAGQVRASPRWLALIPLALLVAVPFLLTRPRVDTTNYRALVARGEGRGIFALIPYGPNEQGFGPKLPPSWFAVPVRLTAAAIPRPAALQKALVDSEAPAVAQIRSILDSRTRARLRSASLDASQLADLLNGLLAASNLYSRAAFAGVETGVYLRAYLKEHRQAPGRMEPRSAARFNRLLLDAAFPGLLIPAQASKWKRPGHLAGYHLLGTDISSRDVLSRMIHGARVSLSVGFVSITISTVLGLLLGSTAAYLGGRIDFFVMRFIEIMMCFPSFFLILTIIAILEKRSILNIMLVIGFTGWTGIARLVRGQVLQQRRLDYVAASVALGARSTRTIFRHILPNAVAPVLVSVTFGIASAILTESGLSFLGFGVAPPTPTWGMLLNQAREAPLINWWLVVFPGVLIFLSVFSYNLVGEGLRDAMDPRLRR